MSTLPQQRLHVDASEQAVHVDAVEHAVDVDPVQQGVDVDVLEDHVGRDRLDHPAGQGPSGAPEESWPLRLRHHSTLTQLSPGEPLHAPPTVGALRQDGAVQQFSEPTRTWFGAAFAEPTPAQAGAWEAIAAGRHALVVAPTGSGKTLSAFLWSIDRLLTHRPPEDKSKRCRVLYVSPLKALAVDVERNLRAPLTGIRHTAERLGRHGPRRARSASAPATPPPPTAARLTTRAARHPDHHARVAVPDAHQPGPRVAARRRDRDRRRGARGRRHQARRPPRAVPRAARRAARPAGPADRAVGDGPAARGGGPLPRRRRPGRDRGAAVARRRGTSGSSCRSRT